MQTKPLLYGLIGFFIGGFTVAVAATTFEKDNLMNSADTSMSTSMRMSADALRDKKSDEFDKAFISEMVDHHQGAIDMAKLSSKNAKHDEIKKLSENIIAAQEKEIQEMKQWQRDWGYLTSNADTDGHTSH